MQNLLLTKYKSDNVLSKEFILENGEIQSKALAKMISGHAEQLSTDMDGFAKLLPTLKSNEALGFGVHDGERYGNSVIIRTKLQAQPDQGILARSKNDFSYAHGPGMMMLDHDPSGEHEIDPVQLMDQKNFIKIINGT